MTSVREIFDTMEYGPAPEGDAPAREWLARHGAKFGHFIAGGWTKPVSLFDVSNPATGKVIAQVSQGSKRGGDVAGKAARRARPATLW
jgi:aldehyde dehydrogenase (NAD+)